MHLLFHDRPGQFLDRRIRFHFLGTMIGAYSESLFFVSYCKLWCMHMIIYIYTYTYCFLTSKSFFASMIGNVESLQYIVYIYIYINRLIDFLALFCGTYLAVTSARTTPNDFIDMTTQNCVSYARDALAWFQGIRTTEFGSTLRPCRTLLQSTLSMVNLHQVAPLPAISYK